MSQKCKHIDENTGEKCKAWAMVNSKYCFFHNPETKGYLGTLYQWVSQKKISYVKIGRLTKFDLQKIDEWIGQNTVEVRKVVDRI